MTRLARMVASGLPHHVTQRGNRREPIFFEDGDQEIYRDLLGEQVRKAEVEVWAYCLMPNHVHLILNPRQADGLGRAVHEVFGPQIQSAYPTNLLGIHRGVWPMTNERNAYYVRSTPRWGK
jgi:REP element-mobilizing transposase RayT